MAFSSGGSRSFLVELIAYYRIHSQFLWIKLWMRNKLHFRNRWRNWFRIKKSWLNAFQIDRVWIDFHGKFIKFVASWTELPQSASIESNTILWVFIELRKEAILELASMKNVQISPIGKDKQMMFDFPYWLHAYPINSPNEWKLSFGYAIIWKITIIKW